MTPERNRSRSVQVCEDRPDRTARAGRVSGLLLVLLAACAHPAPAGPPPGKSLRLNAPGTMVNVDAALVADYVTIVDFWSDSCGACKIVGEKVSAAIANDARVVVREVDVGDGLGDVAKAYEIGALPHYNVYDRSRKLRYVLVGGDCLKAPDLARALAAEEKN